MILTGKAKEDFIEWKNKNYENEYFCTFSSMPKQSKNALIIEWFDSVGIYIEVSKDPINFLCIVHKGDYKKAHFNCGGFDTRQEATEEAIKKANEIYNKS